MPTVLRLMAVALLLVVTAVPSGPAFAEPTEEAKRKAADFYMEAQRLFDAELYSAAIENFKKSQELYPAPATLYNIAKSYERLADSQNCVDYYQAYLDAYLAANGSPAPDSVDVRNSITKCRLGAKVEVRVDSKPPGAQVYIGDKTKLLGQTPYSTRMDAGTYKFFLDLNGYQPIEREIVVRPGEPLQLVFEMEKFRRVGTLSVKSNIRDATIFIDGRNIGLTPYGEDIVLEEGTHQITMSKEDYNTFSTEISVVANESYEVKGSLFLRERQKTAKGPLGWTAIALGAALSVGGVLAGQQADTKFAGTSEFDDWAFREKLGYGLGGGLGAVGLALIIWEYAGGKKVKAKDKLSDGGPRPLITPLVGASPNGGFAGARVDF
ncbi:MAG: PEGA domain-containing protein [Deltaproteobacteria bacterium]|nr:PEGA domain-containing protein [Deltaproteobacteria bacterium]MCB9787162.1 PEGA domain-containing protein [Deltaproteobacteria bacterium]